MLKCMLWKEHNHRRCWVTSPERCHMPHIQGRTMDHHECMAMAGKDIFGGSHVIPSDSPHKSQYCCPLNVPAMTHTTKQVIIIIIIIIIIKGDRIMKNTFLHINNFITQQTLSLSNVVDTVVHALCQLGLGT